MTARRASGVHRRLRIHHVDRPAKDDQPAATRFGAASHVERRTNGDRPARAVIRGRVDVMRPRTTPRKRRFAILRAARARVSAPKRPAPRSASRFAERGAGRIKG